MQLAVAAGQAQMETDARGQSGLSETDCQAHFLEQLAAAVGYAQMEADARGHCGPMGC